jgi:hypothetical protein
MSTTAFVNHTPDTYKVYRGLGNNGKVGYYIMFLNKDGSSYNANGGKIYRQRQNANRDCWKLNHPVQHAMNSKKAQKYDLPAVQAYFDGYVACVATEEDCTTGKDVYCVSIRKGEMPPHFYKGAKTIEDAEEEIRNSFFPLYAKWEVAEQEEN